MSSIYENSKLLCVFSTQFDKFQDDMSPIINCGANGYVLKALEAEKDSNGNYNDHYNIKNMAANEQYLESYTTVLGNFVNALVAAKSCCKIWLGTPSIDSLSYYTLQTTGYSTLIEAVTKLKKEVGDTIWENNIQGFFYNQEGIYGEGEISLDTTDTSIVNLQYIIMNNFSYYVHNTLSKDLIWIPYLPYKDMEDYTHEEYFKRLGTIIRKTTCFDCVYIQPHITPLYGELDYPDEVADEDEFEKQYGYATKNAETIAYDTENQDFYYRDKRLVISEDIDRSSWDRTAMIGAEYELNADSEYKINQSELGKTGNYTSSSLFRDYSCFDRLVGEKPIAFYWQSTGHLDLAFDTIRYLFNRRYCDTTWTTSKTDSNAEVETVFNIGAGSRTKTDVTYTSDLEICEGDIIQVYMNLGLDISNVPSNEWETSEDYSVEINGYTFNIAATAGANESGTRYFIFNGNTQSDSSYINISTTTARTSVIGENLYTHLHLPYLLVDDSSMGYHFELKIWVNGRQVL